MITANKINKNDCKPLFALYWPARRDRPEVWTLRDFETNTTFVDIMLIESIRSMNVGDRLVHKQTEIIIARIPDFYDLLKKKEY